MAGRAGSGGGGVCSLANYSVAYEETHSKRASNFRDCVCSLFPKAILFDFYFICGVCFFFVYSSSLLLLVHMEGSAS